ncbi:MULTISPECIES: peptidoglycan recognition protein family protein [Burkholderia]|uniref:peptidoglycan recognition protein family protein n=1 Tax=Burkholderia TaxID=32008 RepID=UPI001F1A23D5|nr:MULTISPECIES: peptidoglycan recognition family protein [Burkholderia]
MLLIDSNGMVVSPRVVRVRKAQIERGAMQRISGVIVHQTGGSTAASALNSYQNAYATGAHFLIEKDGTIYQTASLKKQTWHVGANQGALRCRIALHASRTAAASPF